MAKPTMLKLALVIALSMAAASTASAISTFTGANNNIGGSSFSASNKVSVVAITNGTNSTTYDGQLYSIRAYHSGGDKCIGGKSGDSRIYFATTTPGNASAYSGAATTDDYAGSGATWSSM